MKLNKEQGLELNEETQDGRDLKNSCVPFNSLLGK
jgi:hypothetical protein